MLGIASIDFKQCRSQCGDRNLKGQSIVNPIKVIRVGRSLHQNYAAVQSRVDIEGRPSFD
jgi:hypothetical protein